jgi:hypothetical protein
MCAKWSGVRVHGNVLHVVDAAPRLPRNMNPSIFTYSSVFDFAKVGRVIPALDIFPLQTCNSV